jgi:Leucine-rich repeat (LRR) protein
MRAIKQGILPLILVGFATIGWGQSKLPIFNEKADSVEYQKISLRIVELFKAMRDTTNINRDSISTRISYFMKRQESMRDKIVGYRYAFEPSYRVLEDILPEERDTITQVTIIKKSELPAALYRFKKLKSLELIDNRMSKLPRRLRYFKNLTTLKIYTDRSGKKIKLSRNSTIKNLIICSSLLPNRYNSLKKLHRLDLSKNNLTDFPKLKGCKKLKELSLRENQLTLENLNTDCENLEVLELQNNQITHVPASIARFANLKRLVLNFNQIESMDGKLAQLNKLEQLGLYSNQLTALPEALYQLTSLKELDLYYNQIERLDEKAANWKKLEVLYLSNNKLISLPQNMGELINLRELYLHNNRLSGLPESLSKLFNLKILRVNSNYLPIVSDSLVNLKKIERLDIANNQLNSLPLSFFHLPQLKFISLLGNQWDDTTRKEIRKQAEELEKKEVLVLFN